jgi:hypothetical protein
MIDCRNMIGKVVKVRNIDGDIVAARLIEIVDEKFLKLRFRNRMEAFIAINAIDFITPVLHQPPASEVI